MFLVKVDCSKTVLWLIPFFRTSHSKSSIPKKFLQHRQKHVQFSVCIGFCLQNSCLSKTLEKIKAVHCIRKAKYTGAYRLAYVFAQMLSAQMRCFFSSISFLNYSCTCGEGFHCHIMEVAWENFEISSGVYVIDYVYILYEIYQIKPNSSC